MMINHTTIPPIGSVISINNKHYTVNTKRQIEDSSGRINEINFDNTEFKIISVPHPYNGETTYKIIVRTESKGFNYIKEFYNGIYVTSNVKDMVDEVVSIMSDIIQTEFKPDDESCINTEYYDDIIVKNKIVEIRMNQVYEDFVAVITPDVQSKELVTVDSDLNYLLDELRSYKDPSNEIQRLGAIRNRQDLDMINQIKRYLKRRTKFIGNDSGNFSNMCSELICKY